MSSRQVVYAQKRRSTRIDKAMPLAVQGVGALQAPFQEEVTTITVSCHGCTYRSKNEVIQGDFVNLEVNAEGEGRLDGPRRARVKWVKRTQTKDQTFEIAVEFDVPGNIWGITPPAEDWFPVRETTSVEPPNTGRELRVVARNDSHGAMTSGGSAATDALLAGNPLPASLSPVLAQLMMGLSQQIQVMASGAVAAALASEKDRLVVEFRAQLRDEAARTLERAVAATKEELARQLLKEVHEAHEAFARKTYEQYNKQIAQVTQGATQRIVTQEKETSERLDGLAAGAVEKLQRNMEVSRSEAVERFVSRLRDQVTPLLEEAKTSLQKLAASEASLQEGSQTVYAQFQIQLEANIQGALAKARGELEKDSDAIVEEATGKLLKLSEGCEKGALDNLGSLAVSAVDSARKSLEDTAAEISRQFSNRLESLTTNYLASLSASIAELAKKNATTPTDS